jgi:glycosidase
MVALPFWRDFRKWVRDINPEAYLTGEIWWQDWSNDKMFNATPWLSGDAFDAVMNYRWAREVCSYFIDKKNKITATDFEQHLASLRNDYRDDVNYVLMNLMDSHDTDRLTSRIVNPDMKYDHQVGLNDNREYNVRKPFREETQIQKLIALFQMTYVGAPMIYYGDEVGMWGGDDPDERKPMLWANFRYDDEISHPFGMVRPIDKNTADLSLFKYYKSLIRIRKEHPALQLGTYKTLLADDANDLFVFVRSHKSGQVLVAINNSDKRLDVEIPLAESGAAQVQRELLERKAFKVVDGRLHCILAPKSGNIFQLK